MSATFESYRLCRDKGTIENLRKNEGKYHLPKTHYITGLDMYKFLEVILKECEKDYALICHDDVILPENIEENVSNCISSSNDFFGKDNWGVIGNAGVVAISKEPITFISDPHTQIIPYQTKHPQIVESIDGNTMLLNIKNIREKGVRIPENLNGFHLYDLVLCMEIYKSDLVCAVSSWLYVMHKSPGNYDDFIQATNNLNFQNYFKSSWSNHTISTMNGPISIKRSSTEFGNYFNLDSFEKKVKSTIIKIFNDINIELNILTRIHIKSTKLYRLLDSIRILNSMLPKQVTLNLNFAINNINKEDIEPFINQLKDKYLDINIFEQYISDAGKYPRHGAIKEAIKNMNNNSYLWMVDYDDFVMPNIGDIIQFLLSDTDILIGSSSIFEEVWDEESLIPTYSTFKTTLPYTNGYKIYDGINKTPICSVISRTKIIKEIFNNYVFLGDYYEDYTILLLASLNYDIKGSPILLAGISWHKDNTIAEKDRTHWDYSYSTFLSYLVNHRIMRKNYYDFHISAIQEIQRLRNVENEFNTFRAGKIWKSLEKYRTYKNEIKALFQNTFYKKVKKYTKNFFINIRKDGFKETFKRILSYYNNGIRNKCRHYILSFRKYLKARQTLSNLHIRPLINVYITVCNNQDLLQKTINSITKQIYKKLDIIFLDPNSPNSRTMTIPKEKIQLNIHKPTKYDFSVFLNSGDILSSNALLEFVISLNNNPEANIIYSDSEVIDDNGKSLYEFFKPDWSPDMFLSMNYMSPSVLIRNTFIDRKMIDEYYVTKGYKALLRISNQTKNIIHIPKLLYSERYTKHSTALEAMQTKALKEHMKGSTDISRIEEGMQEYSYRVKYKIRDNPLVSIIIPTKDKLEILSACISSILNKTTYENYEIIIVDTGSTEKETELYYEKIERDNKIKRIQWTKDFNYSSVNNFGTKVAKGKFLLFLNNDTEIITADWIQNLLEHAQRDSIGAVGAKLYYPNGTIQHAGVVIGLCGPAAHIMNGESKDIQEIPYTKDIIRNWSAVTAACMMIERNKFQEVGGFDEELAIAFNDIDLCLKLAKIGYYNLYTPYAELFHHESISVGQPNSRNRNKLLLNKEVNIFTKRWRNDIDNDPYFNINYSKNSLKLVRKD